MASTTGPLLKEQFSETFNANIETIERGVFGRAPAEYSQLLKVENTDKWFEQSFGIQGVPAPTQNRDLEAPPQVSPVKGYANVIRLLGYRSQLTVEESIIKYARHKEVFDNAADMLESAKTLMDRIGVNLYNNGFSVDAATDFTEADGTQRAFFSTGHYYEDNSATYSNYNNVGVPPNIDTLYTVISQYLGMLKDNAGNYIDVGDEFTILTPMNVPEYRKAADRIVNSSDDPETANRAVNTIRNSFRLSHKSIRNLTSSTKWFVSVPTSVRYFPLVMKVGEAPKLSPMSPVGPINPHALVTTLKTEFGVGKRVSPRGIVAIGV
jgi:hypothetical protein